MPLLGLPPELFQHIARMAMPEAFEAFLLSCRSVYDASKVLIADHNEHCRLFKHITLPPQGRPPARPFADLLTRLAEDPLAARYIETLDDFEGDEDAGPWLPGRDNTTPEGQELERHLETLIDGFCSTGLIKFANARSILHGAGITSLGPYEAYGSAILLLLLLLPNLREFAPPYDSFWFNREADQDDWETDDEEYNETAADENDEGAKYWKLALLDLARSPEGRHQPLTRLQVIRPFYRCGYESMPLQDYYPFMLIPSVRTMQVSSCMACEHHWTSAETGAPFTWLEPSLDSNISRLELAHCCIAGVDIGKVVYHMPQLRILRYSHATKYRGALENWDAGDFIAHIGKWRADSLEVLSVTMPALQGDWDSAAPFLKQFSALQDLELDIMLLDACRGNIRASFLGSEHKYDAPFPLVRPAMKTWGSEAEAFILGDILPDSLQHLRLVVPRPARSWFWASRTPDPFKLAFAESLLLRVPHGLESLTICRSPPAPATDGDERPDSGDDTESEGWRALGNVLPESLAYTYVEDEAAGAAWHEEFFAKYPRMREQEQ